MKYIPEKGDIVWLNFEPQAGKEILKRRPAIVLSPKKYNQLTSMFIVCPATTKIKNYPFEVEFSIDKKAKGAFLADQIKSLDWKIRKVKFIKKSDSKTLNEILAKISALIF
ncbi:MAG: endoribonuclease MazF [Rickettsiales bacterium]|nr:endoribonuclease MazF [Rickettsiales bacterium]